jgi:mycothiol synthase
MFSLAVSYFEGVNVPSGLNDNCSIAVPDSPAIPGLEFRGFRGEGDYKAMLAVIEASKVVDQDEWTQDLEDIARTYRHLKNCDPFADMIFAEIEGHVVGYGRTWWEDERKGDRVYSLFTNLAPDWRGKGIRRAMLRWLERHARVLSEAHPTESDGFLQSWASEHEHDAKSLLESEGFEVVRWDFEMVRSLAEEIQPAPLPEGLEIRTVSDVDAEAIFAAASEAFADHWGVADWFSESDLAEWRESPTYNPDLWEVAFSGDDVAGMVLNFVNTKENTEYKRKRGYTEAICVRRPWRRRGLAKALITRSMEMFKEMGMTETAHGVDTQNPNGALQLYEGLGYRSRRTYFTFRKPLAP